mmetsp:Transcript_12171/g.42197  ORF Transcript_12171/g.42197 Transcript_12171/m.42197 type:complete len:946 (+) Transcript_12171:488-3325(+)
MHVLRALNVTSIDSMTHVIKELPAILVPIGPEKIIPDISGYRLLVLPSVQAGCLCGDHVSNYLPPKISLRQDVAVEGSQQQAAVKVFSEYVLGTLQKTEFSCPFMIEGVCITSKHPVVNNQVWGISQILTQTGEFLASVQRATLNNQRICLNVIVAFTPPEGSGPCVSEVECEFIFHHVVQEGGVTHFGTIPYEALFTGLFIERQSSIRYVQLHGLDTSPLLPSSLEANRRKLHQSAALSIDSGDKIRALPTLCLLALFDDAFPVAGSHLGKCFLELCVVMTSSAAKLWNYTHQINNIRRLCHHIGFESKPHPTDKTNGLRVHNMTHEYAVAMLEAVCSRILVCLDQESYYDQTVHSVKLLIEYKLRKQSTQTHHSPDHRYPKKMKHLTTIQHMCEVASGTLLEITLQTQPNLSHVVCKRSSGVAERHQIISDLDGTLDKRESPVLDKGLSHSTTLTMKRAPLAISREVVLFQYAIESKLVKAVSSFHSFTEVHNGEHDFKAMLVHNLYAHGIRHEIWRQESDTFISLIHNELVCIDATLSIYSIRDKTTGETSKHIFGTYSALSFVDTASIAWIYKHFQNILEVQTWVDGAFTFEKITAISGDACLSSAFTQMDREEGKSNWTYHPVYVPHFEVHVMASGPIAQVANKLYSSFLLDYLRLLEQGVFRVIEFRLCDKIGRPYKVVRNHDSDMEDSTLLLEITANTSRGLHITVHLASLVADMYVPLTVRFNLHFNGQGCGLSQNGLYSKLSYTQIFTSKTSAEKWSKLYAFVGYPSDPIQINHCEKIILKEIATAQMHLDWLAIQKLVALREIIKQNLSSAQNTLRSLGSQAQVICYLRFTNRFIRQLAANSEFWTFSSYQKVHVKAFRDTYLHYSKLFRCTIHNPGTCMLAGIQHAITTRLTGLESRMVKTYVPTQRDILELKRLNVWSACILHMFASMASDTQ